VTTAIEPLGIALSFAAAVVAVAAVQSVSLRILRRPIPAASSAP
jgi:hypothetical protein